MLIGEVSERSGVSVRMLRHYDSIGLLSPSGRTSAGYREYFADDLRRLFHIEGLRSLGLGLRDVAAALEDLSFDPTALVERLIARTRERVAREQELLRRLSDVASNQPNDWGDVLRTIAFMRAIAAPEPADRQRVALADDGDGNVAALAEATLDERDINVAGTLDWALARRSDDAVPILAATLDSPDAARRRRAVEALQKIGSTQALDALAAAIDSPDALVCGRAALVLGRRGSADAIGPLLRMIVEGRDDVEAAETLGSMAATDAETIAGRISRHLDGATADVRRRLTQALAEIPGPDADSLLDELRADDDPQVAATATFLLAARARRG